MPNGTYVVEDDVFTYTTKKGASVVIDFDLPVDVINAAMADENATEEQQFEAVKSWISEDTIAAIDGMGALERVRFYRAFFDLWAKAADIPLGESLSSSSSSGSTDERSGSTSAASSA